MRSWRKRRGAEGQRTQTREEGTAWRAGEGEVGL